MRGVLKPVGRHHPRLFCFYVLWFFSLRQLMRGKWEGRERDLRNEPVAKVVLQTPKPVD